jgi:hypothetical protein
MNDPGIFADRLNDGPGRCSAFYAVTMPASEKIDAPLSAAFGFAVDGANARVPCARAFFYLGGKMSDAPHYRTEEEIEDVVHSFERCSYTPEEFVHARHLTVAAWFFATMEPPAARQEMRAGLRRFIAHHGKNGYHVTITEFWLEIVGKLGAELREKKEGLVPLVNSVVERCSDKNLVYEFYSRERIASPKAKARWIEPDIKSINRHQEIPID